MNSEMDNKTLNIIHEFRRLYEDKMKIIDSEGSGDCSLQAKLSLQQDWIRDLNEQNEMLVRAVEELEQEATERVIALEERLRQSAKCACEVLNGYKDLSFALQEMCALRCDIGTLLAFIKRSAMEGTWELDDLQLTTTSITDLSEFVKTVRTHRLVTKETATVSEKLQKNLALKEQEIVHIKEKLDDAIKQRDNVEVKECCKCIELKQSMSDMRDVLTAEVADKHDVILSLKRDVAALEEQCRKADQQTHFKDDIIKELRKELKQLRQENEERLNGQLKQVRSENRELCAAIQTATAQLQVLEDDSQKYCNDSSNATGDHQATVDRLEAEKLAYEVRLRDVEECNALKIAKLESLLSQYQDKVHNDVTTMTDVVAAVEMAIDATPYVRPVGAQTADTSEKHTSDTWLPATARMRVDGATCMPCVNDACTAACKHVRITEEPDATFVQQQVSTESSMVSLISKRSSESAQSEESEDSVQPDKDRIADLEQRLTSALRDKDKDVEEARSAREGEIANLREVIRTMAGNLEKEQQRADSLQKAVDLYRSSLDTIKESEGKFKKEIMDQRQTISNLQTALVQTKHSLDEVQQRSAADCEEHSEVLHKLIMIISETEEDLKSYAIQNEKLSALIEALREENLQLETALFHNAQDLELYEANLSKYQSLYTSVEAQNDSLKRDNSVKESLVEDLSLDLSECREELSHLFSVINADNQADNITSLNSEIDSLTAKLQHAMDALEAQKLATERMAQKLAKSKTVTMTIRGEMQAAHAKLREAAMQIAADGQRVQRFAEERNECLCELEAIRQALAVVQTKLNEKCAECGHYMERMNMLEMTMNEEGNNFKMTINNLNESIKSMEVCCLEHCQELRDTREMTAKLQQEVIDKETGFYTQINKYQSEQERLIGVIALLEAQLAQMSGALADRERTIEALRMTACGNEAAARAKHEEVVRLKNETNTLIATHAALQGDAEQLRRELALTRATLAANDDKHKLIINELEACLNDAHVDKEFLARSVEQLQAQMHALQEMCNSKAESMVNMEMELNDTKYARDSLCNESRQVIDHVRAWLEEQRRINADLKQHVKHKNELLAKIRSEKKQLLERVRQLTASAKRSGCGGGHGAVETYPMQVIHSPPPTQMQTGGGGWSVGSVDSAQCSVIDDYTDWEEDIPDEHYTQVWIHRVECLTEELQRSNHYWKSRISEHEYTVSRDK